MSKLTGNLVVGQSGGPTAVINQSLVGVVQEALRHAEIREILGARHAIAGILGEDFIDLRKEDEPTLEAVASTPSAALGSVRKKPTEEERKKVFEIFKKRDVRFFFYIGGNDSAETADLLAQQARAEGYPLRAYHVPKTVDNDLLITDHCPGYPSAARFVAMATMGDDLDNRSLKGVKIDVTMGRHAGFLTAASVLGQRRPDDAPHLVYCPEKAFDEKRFVADVEAVYRRLGRCVVVVSEGIHRADGSAIGSSGEKDSHGNVQLSGTGALGDFLVGLVKEGMGPKVRARADTFGYLQRCFPTITSEVDRREARQVGRAAVAAAVDPTQSEAGSIAIRRVDGARYASETFVTPLASVAKNTRSMPAEFLDGDHGVSEAFRTWAAPLVGELPAVGFLAGVAAGPKAPR